MNFNSKDLHIIHRALIVAADRYKEDAKVMRDGQLGRLAEQFDHQEQEARALAEQLAMEEGF